ncbi:MAG: heme ABC transporter permease [Alphaproteobacteria bacterium]|nr:heme ABC transporter permease [Alphaproteobacteria bacterium]
MFHRFANPARFSRIASAVLPWSAAITVILFAAGIWFALFASPADYQQGQTVRIMYVHVPSAWMAMACYTFIAVMSVIALVWKHPLADIAAKAAAPLGAAFTIIVLVTGSLWGKPTWGTWWVWDARLTSVLVLFFLYLGHIALTHAFDNPQRGARAAAVLALVGFVNIPIIKFSVDWWNTLHQPASLTRLDTPAIDSSMLTPLLLMAFAFMLYFVTMLLVRMRADLNAARTRALRLSAAERATAS